MELNSPGWALAELGLVRTGTWAAYLMKYVACIDIESVVLFMYQLSSLGLRDTDTESNYLRKRKKK